MNSSCHCQSSVSILPFLALAGGLVGSTICEDKDKQAHLIYAAQMRLWKEFYSSLR